MKSKEKDLTGEACQRIKEMILRYELRPGRKLEHQALSERLGVSRTPVREALGRLTEEGLVIHVPHRGYFVQEITEAEAEELFELRECLELYSIERAIENCTEPQIRELRSILGSYEDAIRLGVSRRMFLVDENFHLKIAEIAGSPMLRKMLTTLFEKIIMKRRIEGISPLSGLTSYRRHLRILRAIENRDPIEAKRQLREHIRTGKKAVLDQIREREALIGGEGSRSTG